MNTLYPTKTWLALLRDVADGLAVAAAVVVMAACAVVVMAAVVGYVVDLLRVRRRDPVDEHWLTAAAVLTPDHPDLPHAADCDCEDCTAKRLAEIVADFYEETR